MPTNFRPHAPDQNLLLAPRLRDCSFATGASSFYDLILSIEELAGQTARLLNAQPLECEVYPRQIAFNVLPHIDSFEERTTLALSIDKQRTFSLTTTVGMSVSHSIITDFGIVKELEEDALENSRSDISQADLDAPAKEAQKLGGRGYRGSQTPQMMGQEEARKYYENVVNKKK